MEQTIQRDESNNGSEISEVTKNGCSAGDEGKTVVLEMCLNFEGDVFPISEIR